MKCTVFAPSHITGFFEIVYNEDPLKRGSRGAGVAIDRGVITTLKFVNENQNENFKVDVKINGVEDARNASITFKTLEIMDRKYGIFKNLKHPKIEIKHEIEVPIGAGFGSSAGCALGTSLALAKMLELDTTFNEAASIAHLAEIEMQSGLGDVVGEINGGITLRLKEGAPGFAVTDKLISDEMYVISKSLGGIETSQIIGDPAHQKRINLYGHDMLKELQKRPDIETFLKLSKRFSIETGLLSGEVLEIINLLEDETLGASMAMLGNTAFAISEIPETSVEGAFIGKIDSQGCKFL